MHKIGQDAPEEIDILGKDADDRVVAWIEREIGPVTRIEREGRWRPSWIVDAQADGRPVPLYVRGSRGGGWPAMPLSYEAKFQEILVAQGVKAPRVYGLIEDLPAIVMARIPGRPNMARAKSDAVRARLREQLADQMLKIHEIDPALVEAVGSPFPKDPHELTLTYYRQMEELYLRRDRLPAPDMEFARRWVDRNVPPCTEGPAVVTVDAGQFIFEGDELTSMLDFELGVVGDRHVDFAALTTRDRFEMIGDLESFYDLYEQRGGLKLDRKRIQFHRVCFCMATPLQIAHELAHPEWAPVYFEYIKWQVVSMNDTLLEIAKNMGVTLVRYPLPEPTPSPNSLLLRSMTNVVNNLKLSDDAQTKYQHFNLGVSVKYLHEYESRRTNFQKQYFSDVENLTGHRPRDEWDADVQLQEFIKTAGPELDLQIMNVLYRRNLFSYDILYMFFDRTNQMPWLED